MRLGVRLEIKIGQQEGSVQSISAASVLKKTHINIIIRMHNLFHLNTNVV